MFLFFVLVGFGVSTESSAMTDPRLAMHKHAKPHRISADSVAKPEDEDSTVTKHRKFEYAAGYASNNTFMGRRDSVSHLVVSPSFTYTGIKGWNGSLTASHTELTAGPKYNKKGVLVKQPKTPLLDELDAALGWDHDFGDHFGTTITNTHSYFDAKSAKLRSVIDNDLNLGANSEWKYIKGDVSGDWAHGVKTKFGRAKDYFFTFSLSHDFDFDPFFGSTAEFEIEPKVSLVAGTQSFFAIYTKNIPTDSVAIKKLANATAYQKELAKFVLLNYQISVPFTYTYHKWAFDFEWQYNIPQNVPRGTSSNPYPVYMVDIKFTVKGKAVILPKKRKKVTG
jgi:hypothetical protein